MDVIIIVEGCVSGSVCQQSLAMVRKVVKSDLLHSECDFLHTCEQNTASYIICFGLCEGNDAQCLLSVRISGLVCAIQTCADISRLTGVQAECEADIRTRSVCTHTHTKKKVLIPESVIDKMCHREMSGY